MVCHPYDTPTLKTKALHLAGKEERVKHVLLLYKRQIQPLAFFGCNCMVMHFAILHPFDTPTFKTKALRLVSYKGW